MIDSTDVKANLLIKHNIDAILKARGQTRRDLAQWCLGTTDKRADSWLSHIFGPKGFQTREIPNVYLDKIADFFGLAVYQLFQPGISPLSERRKSGDRRNGKDRRISRRGDQPGTMRASDLSLTAADVAFLLRVRSLTKRDRQELEKLAREAWTLRRVDGSNIEPSSADGAEGDETRRPSPRRRRSLKPKTPPQAGDERP